MAKLKKTARAKTAAKKPSAADLQARAEQLSRSIMGSAQQIWAAGIGAFQRAQGEGSKLFEALVKEGMSLEKSTRKLATGRVDAVRDVVEDRVGVVRERAVDTWDRLEKVFEERVQRALNRLGVPGKEDLEGLSARVDALTAELRQGRQAGEEGRGEEEARCPQGRRQARRQGAQAGPAQGPQAGRATGLIPFRRPPAATESFAPSPFGFGLADPFPSR
jgi:poly(hydroxyalkanoate) granule-associated protein